MNPDLKTYIERLRQSKTKKDKQAIQLDLIDYISDLGRSYESSLQLFSDSVIRNKEEWYKKSMTECVHQAGRDVGYRHEANRVEIEAAKALLTFIYDMELVLPEGETSPETEDTVGEAT